MKSADKERIDSQTFVDLQIGELMDWFQCSEKDAMLTRSQWIEIFRGYQHRNPESRECREGHIYVTAPGHVGRCWCGESAKISVLPRADPEPI